MEIEFTKGQLVWVKDSPDANWVQRYYSHKEGDTHYVFIDTLQELTASWKSIKI